MLTTMTEQDWTIVLQVFEVSRSRRGDKGRDDRKFLEAPHYFVVHNITWRTLPVQFGHWNSVWKRFWRLSRAGTFEAFFDALATMRERASCSDVRFHRRASPCFGGGRKRGQDNQALGRSRGGFSTKIHLDTDFGGLPIAFHLPGGEASDSRNFEMLLDIGPDINPPAALGDKGYDSKSNREAARERGICPAIPYRSNTKDIPTFFPKLLYKGRARIEQAVGKLKRFKRIALRCEKTAQNYGSFVALALGFILIKSAHTA
jgi:transposase